MTEHPSTFELKSHFAATGDAPQSGEIESHLRTCESCRRVMAQLQDDQATLTARKPASLFLRQLETRAQNERHVTPKRRYFAIASVAATAVICVVLTMVLNGTGTPGGENNWGTPPGFQQNSNMRWMGQGITAKIHVRRNGETFISDGMPPHYGDQLRYEVNRAGTDKAYASVFALLDGEVISLLPQSDSQSPYEFTDHLVVPGSVIIEPGEEKVELLLFVQPTQYTIESLKNELVRRLSKNEDLSQMEGLVHRLDATPKTETK